MPDYKTIGNFKIDRDKNLGKANTRKVHLAEDLRTKQLVAAKEIGLPYYDEEITKREVDIMKTIPPHSNIINLSGHAIDEKTKTLWLFMEYCPIGDLNDLCEHHDISPHERVDVMLQIAHAIDHIHQLNIAHRDIKPGNVLITKLGRKVIPKLCDFGVSRIADPSGKFSTYAGTEVYMAPEQFKEHDTSYDMSVDIFSFGLLILDFLDAIRRPLQPLLGKDLVLTTYPEN